MAEGFEKIWNFPLCVGAADGKHCGIQCPPKTGVEFVNYKHHFSIVLMAVVDANYNFIYAHAGVQGRISDGGVFKSTSFGQKLQNETLNLPPDEPLPGRDKLVPFVMVTDDAFPLGRRIMKPFPGTQKPASVERIFNYRLSRCRRVVENAFGILSQVFRILRSDMLLDPEKATLIVLVCVVLHNYLRRNFHARNAYCPAGTFDEEDSATGLIRLGAWRNGIEPLVGLQNTPRNPSQEAKNNRKEFAEFFSSELGAVHWQWDK